MTTAIGITTLVLAVLTTVGLFVNLHKMITVSSSDTVPKRRPSGQERASMITRFTVVQLIVIAVITTAGLTLLAVPH